MKKRGGVREGESELLMQSDLRSPSQREVLVRLTSLPPEICVSDHPKGTRAGVDYTTGPSN